MASTGRAVQTIATVAIPARLHLGFLDLHGGLGRLFGGIGLAISGPRTRITVRAALRAQVSGPESDRARRHVVAMQGFLGLRDVHAVAVEEVVPAHAGLGSGTHIALAVAVGLRRLHDMPLDVRGDAIRLGRGARSGVGIGLFDRGGLVVDGGRGPATTVAPIVSRVPFPESWRVLVVLDPRRQGMQGADERAAFRALPPFHEATAAHLCRLVLMQALPAVAECDLASFGCAIKELQAHLGDYYAPVQGGGRFNSPEVAAALALLEREGAVGIGQSSWGPTGFAFVPSPEAANRLIEVGRRHPACRGLEIRVCAGLNHGAEMTTRAAIGEEAETRAVAIKRGR